MSHRGFVAVGALVLTLMALVGCRSVKPIDLELLAAVRDEDVTAVRACLEAGAYVNVNDEEMRFLEDYGAAPLHWAALRGNEELARLLLDWGARVDARDQFGRTPLNWAAEPGHLSMAELLLGKGANVNAKSGLFEGFWLAYGDEFPAVAPLLAAVENGHSHMVRLLLAHGANLNVKDPRGQRPLHWAATKGHVEVARLLLDGGAKVNVADKLGLAPLHLAAEAGSKEMVELLLSRGAKVDPRAGRREEELEDFPRFTPLFTAAREHHPDVVRLLLEHGADVATRDRRGQTALHAAVSGVGHTPHVANVVALLLAAGADVNARSRDGETPLLLAAANCRKKVVQLLLAHGADREAKDKEGRTPGDRAKARISAANVEVAELLLPEIDVFTATALGRADIVAAALDFHAELMDSEPNVSRLLYEAITHGHKKVVELLLDHGASANARIMPRGGRGPLHYAVGSSVFNRGIVELLIARGADVDAIDLYGNTVLMTYLSSSAPRRKGLPGADLAVVELLLAAGAEVNATSPVSGWTALHLATGYGDMRVVELLLANGADPNTETDAHRTPLGEALEDRDRAIAELLVAKGATLDVFSASALGMVDDVRSFLQADPSLVHARVIVSAGPGPTPLHEAAYHGQVEAARLLLDHGADVNARDKFGATPLHHAADAGDEGVVELLIARGANVNAVVGSLGYGRAYHAHHDTPLHVAARRGHAEVVALLLANGAKVNARNRVGRRPLYEAIDRDHTDTVDLLRQHGARE